MKYIRRFNENIYEKFLWTKEFEIMSIKYDDWKVLTPGHPEFEDCVKDCVKSIYNEDIIEIKSVKRLEDGEVFTVGDMLYMNYITDEGENIGGKEMGVLTKIWPSFEQMRGDIGRMGIVLNHLEIVVKK
jgi:hypothetical protein